MTILVPCDASEPLSNASMTHFKQGNVYKTSLAQMTEGAADKMGL